jgi:hypothetical protein
MDFRAKKRHIALLALTIAISVSELANAHPGGLDSSGGHHNRRSGGYHFHGLAHSSSPPAIAVPPVRTQPRLQQRTTYRTKPRLDYSRGKTEVTTNSFVENEIANVPKILGTERIEKAVKLLSFADREIAVGQREVGLKYYRRLVLLYSDTNEGKLAAEKLRDLALDEPFRTWTDRSGKHTVEARFVSAENGIVRLERKNGAFINVAIDSLSIHDQQYVQYLVGKT